MGNLGNPTCLLSSKQDYVGRLLGWGVCSDLAVSLTVPPGGLRFRSQAPSFLREPDYSGGCSVETCFGTPKRIGRIMLDSNHTPGVKGDF